MSRNNSIDPFIEALPAALSQALAEKSSKSWSIHLDEPPKSFPEDTPLFNLILVAGPSKAEAAIQVPVENVRLLAGPGAEPVSVAGLNSEQAEMLRGIVAKACETAARSIEWPQLHVRVEDTISWSAAKRFSLSGSDGASADLHFQVLFSAEWPGVAQASTNNVEHSSISPAGRDGANISLLENVELEVTLRFGQRQLSLREIGELRAGSVVELDKQVQDPAELLLGERVVARGEVVIVDGNYGLRVTEVV
jgi:flagellar motor switch protein FliN